MNTHRFYSSGPISQYEMGDNKHVTSRRARWAPLWSHVGDPIHVSSLAEWIDVTTRDREDPLTSA